MDDFLHNLRSGKLKQADQSRRQYNDPQYKNQQRRGVQDRRKRDHDPAITPENITVLRDLLENMADNQKRLAEAMEGRSVAEDRKATALEKLATAVEVILTGKVGLSLNASTATEMETPIAEAISTAAGEKEKLSAAERKKVTKLIVKLRAQSISYDKIAKYLSQEGYPTLSGKGKWRGQTIKRMFESAGEQ